MEMENKSVYNHARNQLVKLENVVFFFIFFEYKKQL